MSNGIISKTTSGWVTFAGCLMIVAGIFQGITGLVAIFKQGFYVYSPNHLLVLDFRQWGWLHFIFGIVLILSAVSLFAGRLWGRIVAVTMATLSAIVNFGFIWAYPFWSITIIVLDIMVIYAVVVNGSQRTEP